MHRIKIFFSAALHLSHVYFQLIRGIWKIAGVPRPMVTVFGGSRVVQTDPYARQANQFAQMLVNANISVITGGGPGIMEAANCALPPLNGEAKSIGIGVRGLGEGPNKCVKEYFVLDYFFARKWLMTNYSQGFAVFPGGFGTLDELSEVLTLIQTKKLGRVPIVLIGSEYWKLLMQWLHTEALKHKLILKEELELFIVTDDLQEALNILQGKVGQVQEKP